MKTLERLIRFLDEEIGIDNNELLKEDKEDIDNLDIKILYLRKVHSFCFYSGQ